MAGPGPIDYTKIPITPDPDMKEWWEATKQKKFLLRQCKDCGHKWFPPFPGCKACSSTNVGWTETTGRGFVYTYNVVVQPIVSHMVPAVPYSVVIAELEDGKNADGSVTRIGGVAVDSPDDVAIGLPTELAWDDHPSSPYKIPRIKLRAKTAPGMWKHPAGPLGR